MIRKATIIILTTTLLLTTITGCNTPPESQSTTKDTATPADFPSTTESSSAKEEGIQSEAELSSTQESDFSSPQESTEVSSSKEQGSASPTPTQPPSTTPTGAPTATPTVAQATPTPKPDTTPPKPKTLEDYHEELIEFGKSKRWPHWIIMPYYEDYSYSKYKLENPDLDWKTVIFHVNIGYHYPPYTRMRIATDGLVETANKNMYFTKNMKPYDHDLKTINNIYVKGNQNLEIDYEAKPAIENLIKDARKAGHHAEIIRTILTYEEQKEIYDQKVSELGKNLADKYYPRPAHWEHQMGFAATLNSDNLEDWIKGGKHYNFRKWLENNAHNYGFVLYFSKGDPKVTGFEHSWWDIKWIGKERATAFKNQNHSFVEFIHRNYIRYNSQWANEFHFEYKLG